jgi:uncharacterized membrane protein
VDRSRLESFSDGVFAVAITLLALNLTVAGPGHGNGSLAHQLWDHWPAFVAYVISFFTIGVIWVNHHATITNVRVVSRPLLYVNLVLLLVVVAIPFATSTMADYLTKNDWDAHVAAALYAGVFEAMGLAFAAVFEWILRHDDLLHQAMPGAAKNGARLRFYCGQIFYLIAIAVAFISAPVSVGICALVGIYYIFQRSGSTPRAGTE